MNITNLKEKLENIFKINEPIVILINGKWGVGKTYFWHKFKKELTDKKTAYVSLFGKEKIADIRTDIFLQVMSKNERIVNKTKDLFKGIKTPFIDISTLIASLGSQEFKDIIVCFDDFERLSLIKLKEVLGLISELKEQKRCKIVMILNEEELNGEDRKTLSKYKEKIVDYEFNYAPSPSESLAILQNKLTAFKDYPLEKYLIEHKVNNIRIIRRIINALNDFCFIQTHIEDASEVATEIVGNIISVAAINAQTSSFDGFIQYADNKQQSEFDESFEFQEDIKYEDLLSLIEGDYRSKSYFLHSDLVSILRKYCQTSLVNDKSLIEIIKSRAGKQYLYSAYNKIRKKQDKRLYDMSYEVDSYVKDLWGLLKDKGSEFIIAEDAYLHPGNFIYYIEQLKELDIKNKEEYHNFAIKCLKTFIKNNLDWMKNDLFEGVKKILDFDVQLSDYYKECIEESNQGAISSVEQIITMMHDIRINSDWNNEPEVLSKIQLTDIRQYILNNPKYCKEVCSFLYHHGNSPEFRGYVKNTVSIFRDLSISQDKNHAYKAKEILKYLEENNKIKSQEDI